MHIGGFFSICYTETMGKMGGGYEKILSKTDFLIL